MKRIVWTRPEEDWGQDQKILRGDIAFLRFPLTRQVSITVQWPEKRSDSVILTSRKAAEAFLAQASQWQEQASKIEFLTFGLETYKYLLNQGLKVRLIPAHSGKEFAQLLTLELKKSTKIWFPRPAEPAFAIGDYLRANSYEVLDIEMYRTEAIKQFSPESLKLFFAEPSIICLASPSAARSFIELIRAADAARFYRYIPVVIGSTTMQSVQGYFKDAFQAHQATLQALWDKAIEIAKNPGSDSLYAYEQKSRKSPKP